MREFIKYQHVERINTQETQGIENGMCYVFPKIDGTNSCIWLKEPGVIGCGSRNRDLTPDNDNAGFMNWALLQDNIKEFFYVYPNVRLYGEWLVPHTLKTYSDDAWRKFYVFDVIEDDYKYLSYEVYSEMLKEFNIEFIPPICKVNNPTTERLVNQLEKNGYLIKDGQGVGEGVVIKNYDFVNKYGRITWAKIVRNDFKTEHQKNKVTELNESITVEQKIVDKYITLALCEKEYSKIENNEGWSSKQIPQLLNVIYYCLVKEECWNFVKEHKSPTINFKTLMQLTFIKIKLLMPNLF